MASDTLALVNDRQMVRAIEKGMLQVKDVPPMKSTDFVRASGIAKVCPREEVLAAVHQRTREHTLKPDLHLTFIHGHGLHYALQDLVLPVSGDLLWGRWRCNACAALHQATGVLKAEESWNRAEEPPPGWKRLDHSDWRGTIRLRPDKCENCGAVCDDLAGEGLFAYEEYTLYDAEMNIGGHNDGFLKIEGFPGYGVLEAKSIGQVFEVKKTAMVDHIIQCNLYMHFTGCEWGMVFYWHKGVNGLPAFHQHPIARDDELIDACRTTFKSLRSTLKSIEDITAKDVPEAERILALRSIALPDRICENNQCTRAKECGMAAECFPTLPAGAV